MPPLAAAPPAAIVPVPLDEKPQAQLELHSKRMYQVRLQNVSPSVMAFWLDPKNHPLPVELLNEAILQGGPFSTRRPVFGFLPLKSGDGIDISSLLLPRLPLPEGVERIVAVHPQKVLLVYGTSKGFGELSKIIAFLDRPARSPQPELTVFWIDSLAPEAANWSANSLSTRIAGDAELSALESLVRADRALRVSSPPLEISQAPSFTFFLEKPLEAPPASPKLTIPNVAEGKKFESPMPVWKADPEIDPGIQMMKKLTPDAVPRPGTGFLEPSNSSDKNAFRIVNPAAPSQTITVSLEAGKPILVLGAALGLISPTPRFSVAVLLVTPRVVTAPVASSPPIAR